MEDVRQESPWRMIFADDVLICSESREQVDENLNEIFQIFLLLICPYNSE